MLLFPGSSIGGGGLLGTGQVICETLNGPLGDKVGYFLFFMALGWTGLIGELPVGWEFGLLDD